MESEKHSLNAKINLRVYKEYKYIMGKERRSINTGTESVLSDFIERWKKKNKVEEITDEDLES